MESHNHALTTPRRVHVLRSHRHVSKAKKALVHQLSEANVSTSQQISLIEIGCVVFKILDVQKETLEIMKEI